MSDTKPLPAAQLLALADAMDTAFTAWEDRYQHHGIDEPGHDPDGPDLWEQFTIAREAYRAARAASPVTLEELRLGQVANVAHCGGLCDLSESDALNTVRRLTIRNFHMGEVEDSRMKVRHAIDNARRLAGEGGAA